MTPVLSSFFPDNSRGFESVSKKCGPAELNGFNYNEGCDTTKIPIKETTCYCRKDQCNTGQAIKATMFIVLVAFFLWNILSIIQTNVL